MSKKRRAPRAEARRLAQERIDILWEQASDVASQKPPLARQRMASARKIAQKARIKIPRHIGRQLCKKCGTVLVPGQNCRVRMRNNRSRHLTVTCLNCGAIRRFYNKKQ
ncbi:MAG: ribonuclease P protein component 4 [Candidatus Thorarchaeota archaeon]